MLPMPTATPFDSRDYAFEVAWDGVRALASIDHGQVRIWGRDLRDLTDRFPEVQQLASIAPSETIVDGELIVDCDCQRMVLRHGSATSFLAVFHLFRDGKPLAYVSQLMTGRIVIGTVGLLTITL